MSREPVMSTLLDMLGGAEPYRPALVAPGRPDLSSAALRANVAELAGQLHGTGVGRGDRVAIALGNGPKMVIAFLAAATAEGTLALDMAHWPFDSRQAAQPDDVAMILHTSGTTSRPKRVPIRQRSLATSTANIIEAYKLGPEDRALCVMPLPRGATGKPQRITMARTLGIEA